MSRVLMVVGADAGRGANGGPSPDYAVLARVLQADVIDRRNVERSTLSRVIRRIFGLGPAQAWLAFGRRRESDAIFTDGEHVGIPLALLLRLSRSRIKHVTIGHRLSASKKRPFFTVLRAHERMDRIVVHSLRQYEHAINVLGIPARRLVPLPYQVDVDFWAPRGGPEERLVVSAGLEHRDYPTLIEASRGLDAAVVIGAASHWSRHSTTNTAPPPNVRIGSYGYTALRELYARASVVVVPLADVDNQAGVTTILEAMSMGKAVIATQSVGQTDVLEDRRRPERGTPRARPPSLIGILAAGARVPIEPTGFYVAPYDPATLRKAIVYLLDHPDERRRLGEAGRRLATSLLTVEQFAVRIRDVIDDAERGDEPVRAPLASAEPRSIT